MQGYTGGKQMLAAFQTGNRPAVAYVVSFAIAVFNLQIGAGIVQFLKHSRSGPGEPLEIVATGLKVEFQGETPGSDLWQANKVSAHRFPFPPARNVRPPAPGGVQ